MEGSNRGPNQPGGVPPVDVNDWRAQLQPESRQKIVEKLTEMLKRIYTDVDLSEIRNFACRFEERIYTAASSKTDYLHKLSSTTITMERSREPLSNSLQPEPSVDRNQTPVPDLMEGNNWGPNQPGGEPPMDANDWRAQLQPESRQKIVEKLEETFRRHLPHSGPDGLSEIRNIACAFEEKTYIASSSQTDYLRKISTKMLSMEKSQEPPYNSLQLVDRNQTPDPDLMEGNNWGPNQPGRVTPVDVNGWRAQLQPESRQKIVAKVEETFKRHLPYSGPDGLSEIRNIACRFEESTYTAASSQSDYLRKISMKMLSMERSQEPPSNSWQPESSVATKLQFLMMNKKAQVIHPGSGFEPADPLEAGEGSVENSVGRSK